MADKDVVLKGATLKAAVRAAETPVAGELVKNNLVAQLRLNDIAEIDLREHGSPSPAALPHHLGGHRVSDRGSADDE